MTLTGIRLHLAPVSSSELSKAMCEELSGDGMRRTDRRRWKAGDLRRRVCALAICCGVLLAGASTAHAAGELTFSNCEGAPVGCTTVPLAALAGAERVAASPTGSVYVSTMEAVSYFHGGASLLGYGGCISSDGSGGACADTPTGAG